MLNTAHAVVLNTIARIRLAAKDWAGKCDTPPDSDKSDKTELAKGEIRFGDGR